MKTLDVGGLSVRIAGGADREGGGDGPLVVLLHGFGAPGDDLVSLFRVMGAPSGTRWAFPAAPLDLGADPRSPWAFGGPPGARAWWMIDMVRLQTASERGQIEALTRETPPGLADARAALTPMLDALERDLRPSKVVLGGFSQGAMLACDVALTTGRPLAGVVLLSGMLLCADEWTALAHRRPGLRVFQSHGTEDPVLPFPNAEKLKDVLQAGGADVEWLPFRGGHEIPDVVVRGVGRWLCALP
ncbi:MAG: phospholipase [Myxococcales bacterium]|nr:phospholipase [Myxococcales bacterium]